MLSDQPPETVFQFMQEIADRVRVFVLDTSGSMGVSYVRDWCIVHNSSYLGVRIGGGGGALKHFLGKHERLEK